MFEVPEPPTAEEMLASPKHGDLLCYDGERWCVARRDGWYYPVPNVTVREDPTAKDKLS
jgi:hypothetical protein